MMKVIQAFPEYAVNINGDVFSLYFKNRFGVFLRSRPLKLKPNISPSGYYSVSLGSQKEGLMKKLLIHRLVAIEFIPNEYSKPCVNHLNGVKSDNRLINLEWVTKSENEIHAHKNGLKNFKGDRAPYKKINSKIALEIRAIGKSLKQKEIAIKYGVDTSLVSLILNNKIW